MMTKEELKTLAAGLYKNAEEATPIVGDGDKNEWMANRINEIIEENDPSLNCLQGFTTSSEVTDFLERQYEERNEDNPSTDLPCAGTNAVKDDRMVVDPIYNVRSNNETITGANDFTDEPSVIIEEDILVIGDATDGKRSGSDYPNDMNNSSHANTCKIR